jgi:prophage antirepressor-like protein
MTVFYFKGNYPVEVIVDDGRKFWFNVNDITTLLDFPSSENVVETICRSVKKIQDVEMISAADVFHLIACSDVEYAEDLTHWVCDEVIYPLLSWIQSGCTPVYKPSSFISYWRSKNGKQATN